MSDNNNSPKRGFLDRVLGFFANIIISVRGLFKKLFSKKRTLTTSEDGSGRQSLGRVQRTSSVIADSTRNPGLSDAHRTHKTASASRSITTANHAGGRIFSIDGEQKFKKIFTIAAFSVIGIVGIALIIATFTTSGGPSEVKSPVVTEAAVINPSETDCAVTITFGGSVKMNNELLSAARNSNGYDFNNYISELKPVFSSDINFVSLYGNVASDDKLNVSGFKYSNYPPELLDSLANIGVTHIMNASGDSLSLGYNGLKNTMTEMEKRGMKAVGTYLDSGSSDSVYVIEQNHIKIGIGAYYSPGSSAYSAVTAAQNSVSMTDAQREYCVNQYQSSGISSEIEKDIADMKKAGAEIIVIMLNWGGADSTNYTDDKRNSLAQDLIDAGADIVIGTEPDAAQKITKRKPDGGDEYSYVFYSMGNLFADADSGNTAKKYYSMTATFTIERKAGESKAKITNTVCNPIYIHRDSTYNTENTYLKYRVFPAVKYYSQSEMPDFFTSNSQWKASKSAFNAIHDYAKNANNSVKSDGVTVGTYDYLYPKTETEEKTAEGFSGSI